MGNIISNNITMNRVLHFPFDIYCWLSITRKVGVLGNYWQEWEWRIHNAEFAPEKVIRWGEVGITSGFWGIIQSGEYTSHN